MSVSWILDSGASEHMTSDFNLLFNVKNLPKPIYGPSMKRPLVLGKVTTGLYLLHSTSTRQVKPSDILSLSSKNLFLVMFVLEQSKLSYLWGLKV
ncbi:hypothetical protein KY285_017319 [Solanum tuberosum]|nr:hypothetical protein KY284_017306 [Solanum tuberosum]KAH0703041.1 hypothetical protein KY285_017319 [Solanum tuberosum]